MRLYLSDLSLNYLLFQTCFRGVPQKLILKQYKIYSFSTLFCGTLCIFVFCSVITVIDIIKFNFEFITTGNVISDVSRLSFGKLARLTQLELKSNKLTTTAGIHLPGLRKLYLGDNSIVNIEQLSRLQNLTILHLRNNKITSLDGFPETLTQLQYLNLRYVKSSFLIIFFQKEKRKKKSSALVMIFCLLFTFF